MNNSFAPSTITCIMGKILNSSSQTSFFVRKTASFKGVTTPLKDLI